MRPSGVLDGGTWECELKSVRGKSPWVAEEAVSPSQEPGWSRSANQVPFPVLHLSHTQTPGVSD